MERRDFIKKSALATMALSSSITLGNFSNLFAGNLLANNAYDLVAIKGGEPDTMFDKGIAAFGGMQNFVKKGQKVVIKPNIGWDAVPEKGADTNPKLIGRIIQHCFNAGAKEVFVFDHTCDNWNRCYSNSGIEKAVKDAGGKIVSGATESYYQEVTIKQGKAIKNAKVHELILDSDVFINVPVLKNHNSGILTVGMKNNMGIVWNREEWHRNDLQQSIADFATYSKPNLTVVDAYLVMKTNGPRGTSTNDVVLMKQQIISTDIVAADAAAAKIFGVDPDTIPYIKFADQMKIGRKDLSKLNIKKIML
ncbi:MAG: DUF362 domain-containing protein [Ignavibacteriaceae bacterium]|jgi:uncharacterized protein (DUF362 family)